jgi:LacI family transcriptional regulator
MSDVARQAGVSLMTVSRVINHKEDVNPATRQRVQQIIKEMGYHPSDIARSLATRRTRTIGLVVPDVSNPFFADITRGIEAVAYARGYHVFLCNTEENPEREMAVIQSLEEKRVDGLILCSSRIEDSTLVELIKRMPAVVLVNRQLDGGASSDYQSIFLDDELSGELATRHLIKSGNKNIGFLAGPVSSYSGMGRKKGYLKAMQQAGIDIDPCWISHCHPTVDGGHQTALQLIRKCELLTAIFCYNDLVAIGALQACAELGRKVPAQMAIVGHDDIPIAAWVSPALTTCRVLRQDLGAQAVQALLDSMNNCPSGCAQIILNSELIIRQSAP